MLSRRPAFSRRLRTGLSPLTLLLCLTAARAEPAPQPGPARDAPLPPRPIAKAEPALPAVPAVSPAPAVGAAALVPAEPAAGPKTSRELPPLVVARVSSDPIPTLAPSTFLDTFRMADRYQAIVDAGGWGTLPPGLVVKPGARDPSVPALRRHLALTGDLAAGNSAAGDLLAAGDPAASALATRESAAGNPAGDQLDPGLVAAVKSFQARHGLPETGLVGRQTVAALNVPASVRQHQLSASAARLIGSNFPFGDRYVAVNIPSATVEAVERGAVARRYVAVVGKPDKATPRIEARITDVNLNPTWTVPISIIKNEIIPKMRKDPGYLARERIRILGPGGVEVEPTAIDWSSGKAANYTLRQDSGLDNSLGQVRIDMPNRQAVYMHDTPSKSLFAREVRFHSHGCVRVAQVKELAGWLLDGTPGPNGAGSTWGPIEIETSIATNERRDIKLTRPIPVAFVYLTGYATPDGRAHFRDDVYGVDSPAVAPPDVATTGSIAPAPRTPRPAKVSSAKVSGAKVSGAKVSGAKVLGAKPAAGGPVPPGSIPQPGL